MPYPLRVCRRSSSYAPYFLKFSNFFLKSLTKLGTYGIISIPYGGKR
jgi:hypothetical protein